MHNNIMAAGSRDRPPMLATGRYAQWRSRFLRYIDTRPNGDALRKCILKGPYTPTIVTTPEFRDTLIQRMQSVKKSIDKRALHKREYDIWDKVDSSKDIRPIYDEDPIAEVQTTAEINVFATGQQHTEQHEFNNE
ncbi:hypothetical protein Tco_0515468 [Tanacetum coccineum]